MTVQERTAHALFAPMERADAGRQAIRLLVSVQNAAEARAAVDGGAELIDVKQPSRGSLGMATLDDITQVAEFLEDSGHGQPLSVALGEIGDWIDGVEVPPLPPTVAFVKMGLTRAANRPDWRSEWLDVRRRFDDAAARPLDWVAVIYVDGERFGCPDATDVIEAAATSGCRGVLFDTVDKSGEGVFGLLAASELYSLAEIAQQHGMFVALAGQISERDLPTAGELPVDLIAVRSTVCEGGVRDGPICTERVGNLRRRLDAIGPTMHHRTAQAVMAIRDEWPLAPAVGLILGTGCGRLANDIEAEAVLPYAEIPHFPESTAIGHEGRLICGRYGNLPVIAMEGRVHAYEGYGLDEVTLPVRVMHRLGVQFLFIANAAGGLNPRFDVGDVVLIDDYVNLIGTPTCGATPVGAGRPRGIRTSHWNASVLAESAARAAGLRLNRGTYVAVTGPNYETRSEYRYYRQIGGDLIGMSTAPELALARALGLECLAFSIVTNCCNPDAPSQTEGAAVVAAASRSADGLRELIREIVLEPEFGQHIRAVSAGGS